MDNLGKNLAFGALGIVLFCMALNFALQILLQNLWVIVPVLLIGGGIFIIRKLRHGFPGQNDLYIR